VTAIPVPGLLAAIAVTIVALLSTAFMLLYRELQVVRFNARVTRAVSNSGVNSNSLMQWVSILGTRYRRFYSTENLEQMRMMVQTAGFNPHRMMPVMIGIKLLSMVVIPMIAALLSMGAPFGSRMLAILVGVAISIVGPRLVLRFVRRRFNAAVQRGTPDAIDLLVVCSEAGMGLEGALQRVAQEMGRSNVAVSRVLNALLDDLRVLPNRRDAFLNLANRSTADGLRRFGLMISQSLQYGTPLNNTLRAIADELRRDRIIKIEERAHKLGAKLIIPMVIFMLPAMFVILATSPALHLLESLKAISQ
jgi:tight adherence protein C